MFQNNVNVTTLDLEDNNLKELGTLYIAHMLTENNFITDLVGGLLTFRVYPCFPWLPIYVFKERVRQ